MITTDKTARSSRYRILESAISFTENYQNTNLKGNPIYDVVYVSLVSNASIMVYDVNNGIDYGADLQYKRWRLNGATTGLVSPEAHNIYAKLSKSESDLVGDIILSTYNYTTQGISEEKDENGNPLKDYSETHWMIKIGELSALTNPNGGNPDRVLTFDPGQLGTQKDNNEKGGGWVAEMFDIEMSDPKRIRPLLWFSKLEVMFESVFSSIVNFYSGLRIGKDGNAKEITSVATDASANEDDDKAIATPAYVKAFSEARYLRYDTDATQEVNGTVNFKKDLNVEGAQTIGGTQTIGGLQTLLGGFKTGEYSNVGGQITGAHLTPDGKLYVSGLKANNFEIDELVFNVVKGQGGEFVYSTSAIISSCSYVMKVGSARLTPDEFYALPTHNWEDIDHIEITLKEDELTRSGNPFVVGDIIYGKVNKVSESGKHAVGGQCIMHITEIGDGLNITAKLYQVGEYGLTDNIPPIEDMTIAHRGNEITHDGNGNEINQDRRTSFYLSTIDGNLVMLHNVTTPTLSAANYGASLGKLPADLLLEVQNVFAQINENSSVVYADYGIFKNFIQFDLQDQPIQRENNRDEWSLDYANNIGYKNTPSYYDVVTYHGQLYKCLKSGVTLAPDRSSDWLLLVAKGQDGVLSQANLFENSNFDLVEDDGDALKVWKRYNSATTSFNLPLKKSECVIEGEGLGFNAIYKTYTTVGGVITQGTQVVNLRTGLKYTLSCYSKYDGDKPNSSSNSVANTYGYGLTFSGTPASKFKVLSKENVYATNFGSSSAGSTEVYFGMDNGNGAGWVKHSVTFEVTENIPSVAFRLYAWACNLDTYNTYYYSQLKLEVGEVATPYQKNQDDLQGKTGATGYQQGVWNAGTTYTKTSLIAPYVLYSKEQGGDDRYYMLKANQAKGASQSPANSDYWVEFTQFENLFAKFLMADWAKFGGDNGGVFYDRYLFSQKGTNSAGEDSSFDQHMAGDSPMFDQNGALTYTFTPDLFLDFLTGEAKFGRITDSFSKIPSRCYEIRTGGPHNISVPKIEANKGSKDFIIPTIFLPKDYEPLDGVHCSIVHELGFNTTWNEDTRNSSIFVCADKGFTGDFPTDVSANSGWMMWNGYLTKFAFLAPGSMLKLRSVKNGIYGIVWHVENAEDFQIMNADMLLLKTIDLYPSIPQTGGGVNANAGYIDLSESTYTHLYSSPSKKRLENNNWYYKDGGRDRADFIVICSKVYSEYSVENYSGGAGNTFPAGQFRWLFDATGRTDGGLVRHIGRYDSGLPEFKTTD